MDEPVAPARSWWATLPGILTALAAIITAVGGLLAVLGQQGVLGSKASSTSGAGLVAPSTSVNAPRSTAVDAALVPGLRSGAALQSPAQVVAGLRAQGFKGLTVTATDGSVISLRPSAEINGQAFPLSNGQLVQFDRIVSVDVEQPWDGRVKLTLTNGQQLATTTGSYTLVGSNELGQYRSSMTDIRRIDFLR